MFPELIFRAFHARTATHFLHLTSPTYAKHMPLEAFYDEIVDIADELCETWQGHEQKLITATPANCRYTGCPSDPVQVITEFRDWVIDNRYDAVPAELTHMHNIIDEMVALCDRTLYKLKFLR